MGLYLTSSAETCSTIASDCKAQVIIVENDSQLQKILEVGNLCVRACVCVCVCVCMSDSFALVKHCSLFTGFGYQKRNICGVVFSRSEASCLI